MPPHIMDQKIVNKLKKGQIAIRQFKTSPASFVHGSGPTPEPVTAYQVIRCHKASREGLLLAYTSYPDGAATKKASGDQIFTLSADNAIKAELYFEANCEAYPSETFYNRQDLKNALDGNA